MRISIYIATSANGFISNSRGVPDWLSPEYEQGFGEICQRTKAVIMGKRTYDILAPDNLPLRDGVTVVLASDTSIAPANSTVTFTNSSPNEIVTRLEEKGFSEAVIIGGTTVISDFLNAGVVSDIIMVVEPVLFNRGLELLRAVKADHKLSVLEVRQLSKSTTRLHYQITN
jgi:dihydrofolate reductase